MAAEGVWESGPSLQGVRPLFDMVRALLGGRLDVQDGVTLKSVGQISLRLRMVGNVIRVEFIEPYPEVEIKYIIRLTKELTGVRVYDDYLEIEIPNLPNPRFDIDS